MSKVGYFMVCIVLVSAFLCCSGCTDKSAVNLSFITPEEAVRSAFTMIQKKDVDGYLSALALNVEENYARKKIKKLFEKGYQTPMTRKPWIDFSGGIPLTDCYVKILRYYNNTEVTLNNGQTYPVSHIAYGIYSKETQELLHTQRSRFVVQIGHENYLVLYPFFSN